MYSTGTLQDNNNEEVGYVLFQPKSMQCMAKEDYSNLVFLKADTNKDEYLSVDELKTLMSNGKSDIIADLNRDLVED